MIRGVSKSIADKKWEEPIVANIVIFKKGSNYQIKKYKSDGTLELIHTTGTINEALEYVKNFGSAFIVIHDTSFTEVSPELLSDDIMYLFTKDRILKNPVLFTKKTITGDYVARPWEVILADASSASLTVTLPEPIGGAQVIIKKIDNTSNTVTISPSSGTIDGYDSIIMSTQNEAYHLIAENSNWYIV